MVTPAPRVPVPWSRGATVGARVAVSAGLVPAVTVVPQLHVEASALSWLRVGGGLGVWTASSGDAPGVAFGLTAAWAVACAEPFQGVVVPGLCAGVQGGVLHAYVLQGTAVSSGDHGWLAALASLRARARLAGPVSVVASADLTVPITQPRFVLGARGDVLYQQWGAGIAGSLGVEVRFR